MTADLVPVPRCPDHGDMEYQPPRTPEQAFTGAWYACPARTSHRCRRTALIDSTELERFLAEQASRS